MELDAAIVRLLALNDAKTQVSSHGGSSFSSTSKITTALKDGTTKMYFMKAGSGKDAEIMFKGALRPVGGKLRFVVIRWFNTPSCNARLQSIYRDKTIHGVVYLSSMQIYSLVLKAYTTTHQHKQGNMNH